MTDDEMRELLASILESQHEYLQFHCKDPRPAPQSSAPASDHEIARLESLLRRRGLTMSPLYRQFLRVSNGIAGFRVQTRFALRSIDEIISASADDDEWDEISEDFDDIGPVHHFIIGTGDAIVVCGFDPDSIDDRGEMNVVEFDIEMNDPNVHADFEAFLRTELKNNRDDLAQELQDRAALEDD